ncbi:MAG: hypothetical protein ACFFBK_06680 [Promethearchaeota archaeon]
MDFENKTKMMRLKTIHPSINLETVKESTGFELIIPDRLNEIVPPTVKEIKL